ncbi:MAG: hypothetical protein Pg6C_00580 [Treponemataceae bacterium]|nr:MAG: hypothetical protein Pg6C_00580 [Treponemataceae bacterium]
MSFFYGVTPATVSNAADGFKEFKIGDNRAYIANVEEKFSNSGNAMLEITFFDGEGAEIRYYIVDGEYKLSKLKQLQTAFGIPLGDTNTRNWIGKWGIVVCKAGEPYNGKVYNKVSYVRPDYNAPPANNAQYGRPARPTPVRQPVQQQYQNPTEPEYPQQDDGFEDPIPF